MQTIPIADTFSQKLKVNLAGQDCGINLYQKSTGFYCDVLLGDVPVIVGVACKNTARIVRSAYLGFVGDLAFYDTQGSDDPSSPGLGTRFLICYLEVSDLKA